MIKLKNIGSNMTVLTRDDSCILFSYETPVAVLDHRRNEYLKTDVKYSMTTTKHINKWINGANVKVVPQDVINSYCDCKS